MFAIQDEIARAIVETLRVSLLGEQERPLVRAPTKSPEAYDLYLKGRDYWYRRYKVGLQRGLEYFERAIEKDPDYAAPYTGIADVHTVLGVYGLLPPDEARSVAQAAAERAVDIDGKLAEAHFSKALIQGFYWDWDGSERSINRAIELNPNYAKAHAWRAMFLAAVGRRQDEVLDVARSAQTLAPRSPYISCLVGWSKLAVEYHEGAIQDFERVLAEEPGNIIALYSIGISYSAVARHEEAIAVLEKAANLGNRISFLLGPARAAWIRVRTGRYGARSDDDPRGAGAARSEREYVAPVSLASICANVGRPEDAFRYLEAALAEVSPTLTNYIRYPVWDAVQSDPRFNAILARMGIEP